MKLLNNLRQACVLVFLMISIEVGAETLSDQKEINEKQVWRNNERKVAITSHRANYILPASYNTNPQESFIELEPGVDPQTYKPGHIEAKYQISIKFPIINNLFNNRNHIFIAYTASSIWQIYSTDVSSPIRDTDFNPEIFMRFHNDSDIFGLTNSFWELGYSHLSNGRDGEASRSIETAFIKAYLETENFSLQPKYIQHIKVRARTTNDLQVDLFAKDPEIINYIGKFEILAAYEHRNALFSLTVRNNLSFTDNRGSVTASFSYPIFDGYKSLEPIMLYVQYFNGYAENLLDYKVHNQRIGIGFTLNDIF